MNSEILKKNIKEIQDVMEEPDMKMLKKKNNEEFIKKMKERFSSFSEDCPGIFDKVLDNSIKDPQFEHMLKLLSKMEGGELSEHQASVAVGESLVNKYVKPVLPNDNN